MSRTRTVTIEITVEMTLVVDVEVSPGDPGEPPSWDCPMGGCPPSGPERGNVVSGHLEWGGPIGDVAISAELLAAMAAEHGNEIEEMAAEAFDSAQDGDATAGDDAMEARRDR